jgi:hypothetical protein
MWMKVVDLDNFIEGRLNELIAQHNQIYHDPQPIKEYSLTDLMQRDLRTCVYLLTSMFNVSVDRALDITKYNKRKVPHK